MPPYSPLAADEHAVREGFRTRLREINEAIQPIKDQLEADEDDPVVTDDQRRLRADLARLRATKNALAAELVASDLAVLERRCSPTGIVVVDEETINSIVMLSAFAEHPHERASDWLCRHRDGAEALLGMVGYLCDRDILPSPMSGVSLLPVQQQIRMLARVANLLGPERLIRSCERRIRAQEVQLERDTNTLLGEARRKTPATPQSRRRRETAERHAELSARVLERYRNVCALLTGTQTNVSVGSH